MFPQNKLSRLRGKEGIRDLFCETMLRPQDFVLPIFMKEGASEKTSILSLPGLYQWSLNDVLEEVESALRYGIKTVLLFGATMSKYADARSAFDEKGIVQHTIRRIKKSFPDLIVIADCCLCEYTDHGHCFIYSEGKPSPELTLNTLAKIAVSYAEAGADIVAPSGMVDGMIFNLRNALDQSGFDTVLLLSYAVKYASHFYGPFRDAAGSEQFSGHRRYHQLGFSQKKEALLEAEMDIQEGADALMVKPAGFYLDIVSMLSNKTLLPIFAYHVSGEFAMIKAAAKFKILNDDKIFLQ